MKKYVMLVMICCFLAGCTSMNPPDAPEAKGKWEKMHTTVNDIQKGF